MADDAQGVYISTLTMYEEIRGMRGDLIRVEGMLNQLIASGGTAEKRLDDHEERLRHLEERRLPHSALNVVAAVAGAAALIWQAVGHG